VTSEATTSSTSPPTITSGQTSTRSDDTLIEEAMVGEGQIPERSLPSNALPGESVSTSAADVSTPVPTSATIESAKPSAKDALSTQFIDIRGIGKETWPIKGMQKWEGRVLEVDDDIFTAELKPLQGDTSSTLTTEFRTRVLDTGDERLEPGDVFYVTVRPVRKRGLMTTEYSLHLKKPGNWTASDVAQIQERADNRFRNLMDNVE
jgi:hypothetical protein